MFRITKFLLALLIEYCTIKYHKFEEYLMILEIVRNFKYKFSPHVIFVYVFKQLLSLVDGTVL